MHETSESTVCSNNAVWGYILYGFPIQPPRPIEAAMLVSIDTERWTVHIILLENIYKIYLIESECANDAEFRFFMKCLTLNSVVQSLIRRLFYLAKLGCSFEHWAPPDASWWGRQPAHLALLPRLHWRNTRRRRARSVQANKFRGFLWGLYSNVVFWIEENRTKIKNIFSVNFIHVCNLFLDHLKKILIYFSVVIFKNNYSTFNQ